MMQHASALEAAIYLVETPSQVRLFRARPLPDGVTALLRIASGDDVILRQAAEWLGRDHEVVRQAAVFFLEQILLDPDADSYRVLGAMPDAENSELRRNMALLLRWLHPDLPQNGGRSIFVRRVTRAWNDLKTEERRATYDRSRRAIPVKRDHKHKRSRTDTSIRSTHRSAYYGGNLGLTRHQTMRHQRPMRYQRRALHPGLLKRVLSFLFDRLGH
jgi:hypothetical protein